MDYRILIVDSDQLARRRCADLLLAHPPAEGVAYKVTALGSAAAARLQVSRQRFHLAVITSDLDGEGLRLASDLSALYHTDLRLLLLTPALAAAEQLRIAAATGARVLPVQAAAHHLAETVAELLGLYQAPVQQPAAIEPAQRQPATMADGQLLLEMLRRESRSQFALYADNVGHVIGQNGDKADVDLPALSSLVASSFVNSRELGCMLRDPDTIHLNVHEGAHYDVYSANVGHDRLLALLFDKQIADPKLGFVWLLIKRCALQLHRMRVALPGNETLDKALTASLNHEFDRLFGDELFETLDTRH